MKKFVCLFVLIFTFNCCIFIRMDDSVDLGNKYCYVKDYPQTIISYNTEKYRGVGVNIVSPIVLEYEYDKDYIIAKTNDIETKESFFWIVDKNKNKAESYLDSLQFVKVLKERKITLRF